MLTLPPSVHIYVALGPCDMRKQFDGLSILVEQGLKLDARSGHLFVFFNKRCDQSKILFWDRNGYCLVGKRLECGRFRPLLNAAMDKPYLELESCELAMLLDGIDLLQTKKRKRWNPKNIASENSCEFV